MLEAPDYLGRRCARINEAKPLWTALHGGGPCGRGSQASGVCFSPRTGQFIVRCAQGLPSHRTSGFSCHLLCTYFP